MNDLVKLFLTIFAAFAIYDITNIFIEWFRLKVEQLELKNKIRARILARTKPVLI